MNKSDNLIAFPKANRSGRVNAGPDVTHYYTGKVSRRNFEFLPWNIFLNVLIFLRATLRAFIYYLET